MSVTIYVDGQAIETEEGALLIDVLLKNGIAIPHFCYHEALGADGNCRMCMVELKGAKRPQIACDTFVKDGMDVSTQSESILKLKREILELELINHPVDCPICDQAGECKLQDYYMEFGLYQSRLDTPKTHKGKHIDLGSNVVLDQERCVLCARCTRFTQQVTKTHELAIVGRGDNARVATAPGRPLDNPYAMNVVDLCPVGALTSRDFRFRQRVWFLDSVKSICHGCAKGCNIWIDHNRPKYQNDRVYRYRPRINREVNGYFLCDAGRLSYTRQNEVRSEQAYAKGKPIDTKAAYTGLRVHFERRGAVALVDASLSLEQLAAVQLLCSQRGIALFGVGDTDEQFGDDWLRKSDLSSNRTALKLLGIPMDEDARDQALQNADTVIAFNRPLSELPEETPSICFATHNFENETDAALLVPFADFSMDAGTLINCDGRLQRFERSLKQEHEHLSLLQWLHHIDAAIPATNEGVWEQLLGSVEQLENLSYKTIPSEGIIIEGAADA